MDKKDIQDELAKIQAALEALVQSRQSDLDNIAAIKAQIADTDSVDKPKRTRKSKDGKAKGKRKADPDNPDMYDELGRYNRYTTRKPLNLIAHYHAHNLNPGFNVPEPEEQDESKMVVFCHVHKCTHPLPESIYVNFGVNGYHWVCREYAKEHGMEEVKIHV